MPNFRRQANPIRSERGFSVVETLVAASIASVLAASVLPDFGSALQRERLAASTNELVLAVTLARTEASSRRARVAIEPLTGADWSRGWQVFLDANDNGRRDAGEAVVHTFDAPPNGLTVAPAFGNYDARVLSFDPAGLLRRPGSAGLVLGHLTLRLDGKARTLCFSAGAMRMVRAESCT